ncbi:meiosis-specific coiled-coil domain-containing protein MEIOC isoform X1 [Oryzias latipes]|nr:meiosis-specific coiled-coil domain-containing protein MEIOC isoform X1 [Oryzias latipes]
MALDLDTTTTKAFFDNYQKDFTSHVSWSHTASNYSHETSDSSQNSFKKRNPTDNPDYEGEADLQGLVSNILDEKNASESYYSESLPGRNPIWSPKTLREELQCYPSEDKVFLNTPFSSNHIPHDMFNKAPQPMVELSQQFNSVATNEQYHPNLTNRDSCSLQLKKLPPGLPVPNAVNADSPEMRLNKYTWMSNNMEKEANQPLNNYPELSHIYKPPNNMNGSPFDAFYDDCSIQAPVNATHNKQYAQGGMNQLVRSFQSLIASENDHISPGDFPNMHKKPQSMLKDRKTEQYQIYSQAMSPQSAPVMQNAKQLMDNLGSVQHGRAGDLRKQTCNRDGSQHLSHFSPHHRDYFQQSNQSSPCFEVTNHSQKRMATDYTNVGTSPYFNYHIPQTQMHKIKQQMQKEKRRTPAPGFHGEDFSKRHQINTYVTPEKKTQFSHNIYFQGSMQSHRAEEHHMVCAENSTRFRPFVRPGKDLRRHSSSDVNSEFLPKSTSLHELRMSGNEASGYSSNVSNLKTSRREISFQSHPSAATPPPLMNQGPVSQLHIYVDECDREWRALEKERKAIEGTLRKTFPGIKIPAGTNLNLPRPSGSPTKLDHIVVNQMREQIKVANLLERMEALCDAPLQNNIHTVLKRHHMAVCITQARCSEDSRSIKHQQQKPPFMENKATLMVMALQDLAATTRRLRTALWCALQMTLPRPIRTPEYHDYEAATCTEKCSVPFEGYSFTLMN